MSVVAILLALTCLDLMALTYASPACLNTCGGTPVAFPFGTGKGCGSQVFQNYVKCTNGKLSLYTNTGHYEVISIDYPNKILIVRDLYMSTCSAMQKTSKSFGLQAEAPFTMQGAKYVLLACSPSSPIQTSHSSQCDPKGAQICHSLYTYCPSITSLGLSVNSPISSCCLLSIPNSGSPPFEINLANLGCPSYTSIYRFGSGYSYGDWPSGSNSKDANTWSFGIPLHYTFDEAAYAKGCKDCEDSKGSCAFDDAGHFVCICPTGVNVTTTRCPQKGATSTAPKSSNLLQNLWTRGFINLVFISPFFFRI